ncbi:class I SAM-dependent methyltransferase [bacterium]|nr:class I SAM-dependent methyltransferase [bacterium]
MIDIIKVLIVGIIDIWVIYTLFNVLYICFFRGVPAIPSSKETLHNLEKILLKYKTSDDFVFYDLGCGNGKLSFFVAKKYPSSKVVGVEINPFIVFYLKCKKFIFGYKNVDFIRANIFKMDFYKLKPDFIYVYLGDSISKKLSAKLKNELNFGSIVIGNKFLLPDLKVVDVVKYKTLINGPLRVYKK